MLLWLDPHIFLIRGSLNLINLSEQNKFLSVQKNPGKSCLGLRHHLNVSNICKILAKHNEKRIHVKMQISFTSLF